ncbi:MAG: DUF362 domain-containing protein, partial [Actinomycetota bacterium]|nr:DUF362 domain-containing protein [Actinomycetota bacterium]
MERKNISLVELDSYEPELVRKKVELAINLVGGPSAIVPKGGSVFIKVNALVPSPPEKCVTTHPEIVKALILSLKSVTSEITIGDSPGGLYNRFTLERTYEKCGFARVAGETGARLNFDTRTKTVPVKEGKILKSATLCRPMLEADRLISVPKFKTHMLVNVTGAVKNLFGAVPGKTKYAYHSLSEGEMEFADLLLDVYLGSSPDFHLVDAVEAMDGNGPRHGRIKHMGALLGGFDGLAVDNLLMMLIKTEPEKNLVLKAATARGLVGKEVDLKGEEIEKLSFSEFELPTKRSANNKLPRFAAKRLARELSLKPTVLTDKCNACG